MRIHERHVGQVVVTPAGELRIFGSEDEEYYLVDFRGVCDEGQCFSSCKPCTRQLSVLEVVSVLRVGGRVRRASFEVDEYIHLKGSHIYLSTYRGGCDLEFGVQLAELFYGVWYAWQPQVEYYHCSEGNTSPKVQSPTPVSHVELSAVQESLTDLQEQVDLLRTQLARLTISQSAGLC